MPRNEAKPLTAPQYMRQRVNHTTLSKIKESDKPVRVYYVKRDGNPSFSEGTITHFNGRPGMDTGSVTLDTPDKGARTINLHRIYLIE